MTAIRAVLQLICSHPKHCILLQTKVEVRFVSVITWNNSCSFRNDCVMHNLIENCISAFVPSLQKYGYFFSPWLKAELFYNPQMRTFKMAVLDLRWSERWCLFPSLNQPSRLIRINDPCLKTVGRRKFNFGDPVVDYLKIP